MSKMREWLEDNEHLPGMMRDFHDQKDLFKAMHHTYRKSENAENAPNWIDGHMYVVDWFLWYMASRGYTLQKCRKNIEFFDFEDWRKIEQENSPLIKSIGG